MSTVMIRKRRRFSETSDSSEDDSPQCRKQSRSAPTHQTREDVTFCNISQHEPVVRTNSNVSTRSKVVCRLRRQRNRVPSSSTSECSKSSEDEVILHPARRGSLRALSDYETGDSTASDRAHSSQINATAVEGDQQNICNNYVRNHTKANSYSDSSSDESIIQPIYRNRSKRIVQPISTSDSSDSGMLIGFRRNQKRMRLTTTSEESDSAPNMSATNISRRLDGDNRPQTSNQVRTNDRRKRQSGNARENNASSINLHDRRSHISNIHQNSLDLTTYRGINMSQEDERSCDTSIDSDSDTRSWLMQRSNASLYTDSGDSNYSIDFNVNRSTSDSDDSIPVRVTRSRSNRLQSSLENELDSDDDDTQIQTSRPSRQRIRFPTDDEVVSDESIQSASEDELDSDDDDTQIQTSRPLRRRIICPTDDEVDSDESIPIQVARSRSNRPRPLSDLSDDELVNGIGPPVNSAKKDNNLDTVSTRVTGGGSSESDEETERCPICFTKFLLQEIGTPATCEHKFCATCLQKWANNNNTCPVDRKLFTSIMIRSHIGGKVTRQISIETPPARVNDDDIFEDQLLIALIGDLDDVIAVDENSIDEVEADTTDGDGPDEICCVCYQDDRNDEMIVCDYCNEVYHMGCVNPPLQYVPASYWHCPTCVPDDVIFLEY